MWFFGKKKGKPSDKAVVASEGGSEKNAPVAAFFHFNAQRTGKWAEGVKKGFQKRFHNVEATVPDENPFEGFGDQMEQLKPGSMMSEGVKSQIKSQLKANAGNIVFLFLEAGIYCAAFHHAKEGLKHVSRDRKIGPAVRYTCDIMLPNGLYGPPLGFLVRLNLPF